VLWAALAGALVVVAAVRLWRAPEGEHTNEPASENALTGRWALALLALYLGVPVLATWASAQGRPIFNERYLVAAAPPFYLLMAVAVLGYRERQEEAGRHRVRAVVGAVLAGVVVLGMAASLVAYHVDPDYSKTRGWRELALTLRIQAAGLPEGAVRLAQTYPDPVLWYYTGPAAHLVLPPVAHDAARARQEVTALAASGVDRVVLAVQPSPDWDDEGVAQAALAEAYTLVASRPVGGWDVQTWVRAGQKLPAVGAQFENGVTLAGAALQGDRLAPGGSLVAWLDWDGDPARLSGTEKLTVQVLDANGTLAAQTDVPFIAEHLAEPVQLAVVTLPWLTPPGEYRVIAALYDPGQEGAPRVRTVDGMDSVTLGSIWRTD
jgi:hypothetical protein